MSGAFELGEHARSPGTGSWIIVFALAGLRRRCCCVLQAARRFGLQMRAVTQNRRMAAAMGIRTARVDALTFGARLRHRRASPAWRCRRSTTSGPTSARATSSTASWSWCSAASAISGARSSAALTLGHRQQVPRALRRRGARQDPGARLHHPVHPEAPARPVRAQGPGGGGMSMHRSA